MGVRDDVTDLVDDEPGTGAGGDERVAIDRVLDLLRAIVIGAWRLVAVRETLDAWQLGHAGNSVDPGEATEISLTHWLQIQDGDDRGIDFLRDVGDRHLDRLRLCRSTECGAGPAVDHRLRGDLRGKNASRQDAKPGRAEDERRCQCPGQGHLAQAADPLFGHASAPLISTKGMSCPATDTKVTGPGGGKARPAPPPGADRAASMRTCAERPLNQR